MINLDLFLIRLFLFRFRSFIAEPVKPKVHGSSPFPAFRWGDHQLMWDLMAKRETTSYARSPALVMAEKHAAIQPKMRAILLGEIFFIS